jgi:hypothetical protein
LPIRELRRRRAHLAIELIRDRGAIAERPHSIESRHRHVRIDAHAAAFLRQLRLGDQRARTGADGADDRARRNDLAAGEGDRAVVDAGSARFQPHVQALHAHLAMCELAERRRQLGQQAILTVQQDDANVVALDARIVSEARFQEVDQLTGRLDAAEAAADDHECRQPAARAHVGLQLRLLEARDDAVAQEQRVAQRLERQRVLRHALHQIQVGVHAAREHQLVELDDARAFAEIVNRLRLVIDLGHLRHADARAANHLPMRRDDVAGQDRRADHLRQQRIEGDEVLLTHEGQVPVGRQLSFQPLREGDAGEAAADDDEALAFVTHVVHSVPTASLRDHRRRVSEVR